MKEFTFNPFGISAITVSFNCDKCQNPVISEEISIPAPNYYGDTSSESQVENEGYATCTSCEKDFEIQIFVSYGGGDGSIHELSSESEVTVQEIDDIYDHDDYESIMANTEFHKHFNREMENIVQLLNVNQIDDNLKDIYYRQLYSSTIGTMEVYLSDAFINTVFKSRNNLKKFYKGYKDFKDQKIRISEYFEFENKAESVAKKALLSIIYHNIGLVAGLYKDTFDIMFPPADKIYNAVSKRHHFVHRNGKDKDGKKVIIDKSILIDLISDMRDFIGNIDMQLKNLN